VKDLFEHAPQNESDSEMLGTTIHNRVDQNDKPIRISFRCKDQMAGDVICTLFEKVSQTNARSNALDMLTMTAHSVRMPVGFGKRATKSKGRPLSDMAHLKRSVVEVKATEIC